MHKVHNELWINLNHICEIRRLGVTRELHTYQVRMLTGGVYTVTQPELLSILVEMKNTGEDEANGNRNYSNL